MSGDVGYDPLIGLPEPPPDGSLHFENNQWTGYVLPKDFERENKLIPFGPAPPGTWGQVEAFLILLLFKRYTESKTGMAQLTKLIIKYLDTTASILGNLYKGAAAHPLSAIMFNHTCISIYERLGLMTSNKALHERAWVDHVLGELLKTTYVGQVLTGVETLVQAGGKAASSVLKALP